MAVTGIAKAHYLWAALCAIGYWGLLVPGLMVVIGGIGGVIALWVVLTLIGVAGMWMWVPKAPLNMKIVYAWVAVGAVGLAINALQFFQMVTIPWNPAYAVVWFAVTAVGFAYTGYVWPKAKMAYYAGAALNLLCLIGIIAGVQFVGQNVFALLGVASVLPTAYAGYKN